jgi:hypothetical protein
MPKIGGKRKKTRTHVTATNQAAPVGARALNDVATTGDATEAEANVPRSIVVKTSKVTASLVELVKDLRNIMSPNTASNIKERK